MHRGCIVGASCVLSILGLWECRVEGLLLGVYVALTVWAGDRAPGQASASGTKRVSHHAENAVDVAAVGSCPQSTIASAPTACACCQYLPSEKEQVNQWRRSGHHRLDGVGWGGGGGQKKKRHFGIQVVGRQPGTTKK